MINLLNPSRLAGKITLLTFAVSILWIAVISTTLLFFEYRLNERAVIEKLMAVVESNHASISRSIWEFERQLLATQLEAMVRLPSISYARLEETDGTISQFGKISQSYPKEIAFSINFIDRGETIQLGWLKIYPDLEPLNKELISLAFKIFCVQTVNAFVVAIIIFMFVHFFAGRHLTDIAVQAGALSADCLESPITLKRKSRPKGKNDELDILETALNDMRIHFLDDITRRKKARELMNRYVHIISSTNDLMSFIDDQYIYH